MGRPDGRRNVAVTADSFKVLTSAKELANILNHDLSLAMPAMKVGIWTYSDVLTLACIDWIIATKRKHNLAITRVEKALMMKFPYMKQPSGNNIKIVNPFEVRTEFSSRHKKK